MIDPEDLGKEPLQPIYSNIKLKAGKTGIKIMGDKEFIGFIKKEYVLPLLDWIERYICKNAVSDWRGVYGSCSKEKNEEYFNSLTKWEIKED